MNTLTPIPTRSLTQRQCLAWEKYLQGWTLREIADYLYVSHPTIYRDIAIVKETLRAYEDETKEGKAITHITVECGGGEVKSKGDWTLRETIRRTHNKIFLKK